MQPPTIDDVKRLVKASDMHGGVFLGFDLKAGKHVCVTWGQNETVCLAMKSIGVQIADRINAGEIEPGDKPSRSKAADTLMRLLKVIGDPGQCRSCGAAILWVRTKSGAGSPYDLDGVTHWATCPNAKQHSKPKQQSLIPVDQNRTDAFKR